MMYTAKFSRAAMLITAVICVCGLFFLMPYATGYSLVRSSIFHNLTKLWSLDQWQHCWLVPFITATLVYLDRKKYASLPMEGSNWGIALLLFSFLVYWVGYRTENITFSFLSGQTLLAGMIIWLLGWRWMKALLFPWAFLAFMWPLLVFDTSVAFPLRLIMAKSSVTALNLIGIPAVQNGSGILSAANQMMGLPEGKRFSVDVADPCSGMHSLFALTMVTALYAHFTMKTGWQKWLLFLAAAPLAILGNLCRIIMLVFGVIVLGSQMAIGSLEHPSSFHEMAGYLVFMVALLGMIGLGAVLLRLQTLKFESGGGDWESRAAGLRNQPPQKHQDLY